MAVELSSFDLAVVAGIVTSLLVLACIAILFLVGDRGWTPPRQLAGTVWCRMRRQYAQIRMIEWVKGRRSGRSVVQCSLRGACEDCGEDCRDQLTADQDAPGGHSLRL